jgi:hypothetical protein
MNDQPETLNLKIEDTVVVNSSNGNLLIVSFLKSIYDDKKNTQQAQVGVDKCYAMIEEKQYKSPVNVIVDLRLMGNKSHISPKARDVYINFVSDPRIGRVAVLGASDAQTSIANFILAFDQKLKEKLAWFSSEEEAKNWATK